MSAIVSAALLGLLFDPGAEPPESVGVSLAWHAPEQCPQREAIDAQLHRLLPELGELAPAGAPARLRVDGRIELGDGGRWEVSLAFASERGVDERRFSGPDCGALADAAALVIAVAFDPLATSQTVSAATPDPEPALEPVEPKEAPQPVVSDEPRPEPAPEPAPVSLRVEVPGPESDDEPLRARFGLALLGGGGYGPLRLAQAGLGVQLDAFGPWWRAGIRGLWLIPRSQTFAGGGAGRFDGFAIAGRGCGVPQVGRVEFPICVGVEAGSLRGRGIASTPQPRDASLPWAAIVVGPALRWAVLDRLALGLDLELLAPLTRGGFTIDGTLVQSFGPIGVQAFAAVELRLP